MILFAAEERILQGRKRVKWYIALLVYVQRTIRIGDANNPNDRLLARERAYFGLSRNKNFGILEATPTCSVAVKFLVSFVAIPAEILNVR